MMAGEEADEPLGPSKRAIARDADRRKPVPVLTSGDGSDASGASLRRGESVGSTGQGYGTIPRGGMLVWYMDPIPANRRPVVAVVGMAR